MADTRMLAPVIALAAWTFVMWGWMYLTRRRPRLPPARGPQTAPRKPPGCAQTRPLDPRKRPMTTRAPWPLTARPLWFSYTHAS